MKEIPRVKDNILEISIDELISSVVKKDDFCVINGQIEATRNLALKLFSVTKIERYSVELLQVISNEHETVYICKATVARQGKFAEGLGACSTAEVDNRGGKFRHHHDAVATAETRAYKRAIEAVVGLPFINEIIRRLFGSYDVHDVSSSISPEVSHRITPDELVRKIREAKALPHLQNIWRKYTPNLRLYSEADRALVLQEKDTKKIELMGSPRYA